MINIAENTLKMKRQKFAANMAERASISLVYNELL